MRRDDENHQRLCLFMTSLESGGAERVMLRLAEGLCSDFDKIDLVVTRATGDLLSNVPSNVNLVNLNCARIVFSAPKFFRYLVGARPSVVLSAMAPTNVLAITCVRLSGGHARICVVEHNTFSRKKHSGNRTKMATLRLMMMALYRSADKIIAVSNGVAADLSEQLKINRSRISVIYNPVVSDELQVLSKVPIGESWFESVGSNYVLGVGRLVKAKNFPLLLRAFAVVRKKFDVKLIILGEGPERHNLVELADKLQIQDHVLFPGYVDNPYKFMANCEVFALSSNWEGLPTVLIEALACGAKVVSTDCPSGPREISERSPAVQLVPMESVPALADALEVALGRDKTHVDCSFWSVKNSMEAYRQILR